MLMKRNELSLCTVCYLCGIYFVANPVLPGAPVSADEARGLIGATCYAEFEGTMQVCSENCGTNDVQKIAAGCNSSPVASACKDISSCTAPQSLSSSACSAS